MYIETKNLVKKFKERVVVNNVSIKVEQGKIVGLLGPNGAGKTTTFYMIVGLERPDSGHVLIDGRDVSQMAMYERAENGLGYLPQEASIFRKLTVEENIMSILETTPLSVVERQEKLEDLISEFNVGHVRKRKGSELSGGERRRARYRAVQRRADGVCGGERARHSRPDHRRQSQTRILSHRRRRHRPRHGA